MKKLAIITTHPIQYNAPWFRLLAERGNVDIKVFYTWSQSKGSVKDRTFGKEIKWDIPLLDGYNYEFVKNVSKKPGSHHFFGIDCPSLISDIKKYQPNAILFFGWKFKSHLLAMRFFKGKIPVWFRGDSTLLDEVNGLKTKVRRLVLNKAYSYVDTALYVGDANKDYFLKHGLKAENLVHVPHAIENKRFIGDLTSEYDSKALQWRKELGYDTDDIVILFAGKFESKKQPDFLVEAFLTVSKNSSKPFKLLLVGNGPMDQELETISKNNHNIQILPFQNQTKMPLVYRLGNVFCLPSKGPGETWGLAVNEAMACRIPVIVSNKVGCAEDLIKHNGNGYIFSFHDIMELQNIFESLEISKLEMLGKEAQKDIQKYDFESIVTTIEEKLKSLKTKME